MQDLNLPALLRRASRQAGLRPSVYRPSPPERCVTDSAPLSENGEVISWKMGADVSLDAG
jgi:hypothetical protein